MKTDKTYYRAEYFSVPRQGWQRCIYWDGSNYDDITGSTPKELIENLFNEYGPIDYILQQLELEKLRFIKCHEIREYNEGITNLTEIVDEVRKIF